MRSWLLLGSLALTASAVLPSPALAQHGQAPVAWASLQIEPDRPSRLQVMGRTRDPAITAALQRMTGHPPDTTQYGGDWGHWVIELSSPSRHGYTIRQDLRLEPLLEALRARGEPSLSLLIQHPPAAFATLSGASALPVQRGTLSATVSTRTPGRLSIELGWRGADVARRAALLLLALLVPVVVGFAIGRRSTLRDRAPEAWFVRAQSIQLVILAGWIVWMVAVEATQAVDFSRFAWRSHGWAGAVVTPMIWLLGFLPVALALTAIARRVVRRLRGFDPLPRGAAGLTGTLRALGPLLLLLIALGSFAARDFRTGVFALLAGIAAGVLFPSRGPLGRAPQSLSSGALRDRMFDLAHRAGVKLRDLYVVPMRRERLANAFAVNGGVVIVADELLDRMSRREVDAVLAHEITHLEHHHPIKMLLAGMGAWAVVAGATMALHVPYGFALAFTAAWLTYLFVARRFEFAADAGAAALAGDAEAVVAGLGRLARLNDVPLAWGRGWRFLVTHPTTEARARAIGRRAGLDSARVAELLTVGLPSTDHYGRVERPGEEDRVFSTAWKNASLGRLALGTLATAIVVPASMLALAKAFAFVPPHVLVIPAGALLAFVAILVLHDRVAARGVSRLEPILRARLAETPEGAPGERFVALSPGDRARVYEGFLDWDLGLLTIGTDAIQYRGEQTALQVPRRAVRSIEVGAVAPSWIRAPRVIVRWIAPSGVEAVCIRLADCPTVSGIGPASRELAAELQRWRQGAPSAEEMDEGPPGIGSVTSRLPAEAAAPRDLPALVVLLGTLAAAASFVLALDFWLGLDVLVAALIAVMALRWPAMTSREPAEPKLGASLPERRAA